MNRSRAYLGQAALVVGIGPLLAVGIAGSLGAEHLGQAWLVAALFWSAFPVGALPILCTHALTGGGWGEEARPALRAAAATLPLLALFFLPVPLFWMDELFSWTAPPESLPEVVQRKKLYLNAPFFAARSALYLAVWLTIAWAVGAWRDTAPGRAAGAAGAIAWVVATTFFGIDWTMSLEPKFYSDVYGLLFCAGMVAAAMSLAVLAAVLRGEGGDRRTARIQDLANLWLAVLAGWLFLHFVQYLIIWSGNIPHEIEWFIHRSTRGWRVVSWALVLLMFALPFPVLLSRRLKRSRRALGAAAVVALAGHLANAIWLVLPSFHHEGFALPWLTPVVWLGLGGIWIFVFLGRRQAILDANAREAPPGAVTAEA